MGSRLRAATLADLAEAAADLFVVLEGDSATTVTGIEFDSRTVSAGDLFFCVPGEHHDGHDFGPIAADAGAAALCVERELAVGIPQLVVADVRKAMPVVGARALGDPASDLQLLGVTGTNGKTTTAFLIESVLRAAGRTSGLIGTIETRVAGEQRPGVRTTPESVTLHKLFAEMRDAKVESVAMEVTSHALVLHRVDGIVFDVATFTNLTQDHLDFHEDMESYFAAKASLFTEQRCRTAVINADDPYGRRLAHGGAVKTITYGSGEEADVRASDVDLMPAGSAFTVHHPGGEMRVETPLVGPFNVANCLAATATCLQAGIDAGAIQSGISALTAVPGRFEAVDRGQPFSVVVDYAHTPDSLANVLQAARALVSSGGRVICAFGCGGDRDRGKRPLMGMVAARLADVVVVTSDNPRTEDPAAIVGAILEGVNSVRTEGPDAVLVDRRAAIEEAIEAAREGDVVVIAGKGHETGQEFAEETLPFDDRIVAAEALDARGWGG